MKKFIMLLTILAVNLSFSQDYFNTIEIEKSKEENLTIADSNDVPLNVVKDKMYYTYKIKELSKILKSKQAETDRLESINVKNIEYYKNKVSTTKSKNRKEEYLRELEFIELKRDNLKLELELSKDEINSDILKLKDTLYVVIKKQIADKQAYLNLNPNILPLNVNPPVKGNLYITSPYGNRIHPVTNKQAFHNGIDIRAKKVPVYPVMAGKISKIDYSKKLGIYIEVTHKDDYKSIYGHLSEILLLEDSEIDINTAIAVSGNTGSSTAPHLHFIIKRGNKYLNPNNMFK